MTNIKIARQNGAWILNGFASEPVFIRQIKRGVWQLEFADGRLAFGDGFESFAAVRAWVSYWNEANGN